LPLGLGFGRNERDLQALKSVENVLRELGLNWIRNGGGGVDISPLAEQGALLGSVIPDSQKYFDYHHCRLDVAAAVHPRELELQAILLAFLAYFLGVENIF